MPKFGEPVVLTLQLFDGAIDKFVRAIVRDPTGTEIGSSPVAMPHVGNGRYEDASVSMPVVDYLNVTYKVFKDALFTQPSLDHSDADDRFTLEVPDSDILALLNEIKTNTETIINKVNELLGQRIFLEPQLIGKVKDVEIKGLISDDEVKGLVKDVEQLTASVNDVNELIGKVSLDKLTGKVTCDE